MIGLQTFKFRTLKLMHKVNNTCMHSILIHTIHLSDLQLSPSKCHSRALYSKLIWSITGTNMFYLRRKFYDELNLTNKIILIKT